MVLEKRAAVQSALKMVRRVLDRLVTIAWSCWRHWHRQWCSLQATTESMFWVAQVKPGWV